MAFDEGNTDDIQRRKGFTLPPMLRSSLRSRRRTLSNAEIRRGDLMRSSFESGATTRPLLKMRNDLRWLDRENIHIVSPSIHPWVLPTIFHL